MFGWEKLIPSFFWWESSASSATAEAYIVLIELLDVTFWNSDKDFPIYWKPSFGSDFCDIPNNTCFIKTRIKFRWLLFMLQQILEKITRQNKAFLFFFLFSTIYQTENTLAKSPSLSLPTRSSCSSANVITPHDFLSPAAFFSPFIPNATHGSLAYLTLLLFNNG